MPMQMTVQVKGGPELMKKLRRSGIDIKNMSTPLKTSGNYLKELYEGNVFNNQGHDIGVTWPPLNIKYGKRKRAGIKVKGHGKDLFGIGKGPLELTGKMRSSFFSKLSFNQVRVGNKVDYFKYHQQGRGVPKRQMMAIAKPQQKKIVDIFEKYLRSVLKRAWR